MKRFLGIFALAAMIMASCTEDDTQDVIGNVVDDNSISLTSIVNDQSAVAWATDDEVGVYQFNGDQTLYENVKYYNASYNAGYASFMVDDAEQSLKYIDDKAEVMLYYPYTDSFDGSEVMAIDLTDQSLVSKYNLYTTGRVTLTKGEDSAVVFENCFDLPTISFRFTMEDGGADADMIEASISLSGLLAEGEYDLMNNEITVNDDAVATTLSQISCERGSNIAEVYTLPQSAANLTLSVSSVLFGLYEGDVTLTDDLEMGGKLAFDVEIDGETMTITAANIKDWESGDSVTGDGYDMGLDMAFGDYLYSDMTYGSTYDSSKTLLGVVYILNEDGRSGKVLSVKEGSATAWTNSTYSTTLIISNASYGSSYTWGTYSLAEAGYGMDAMVEAYKLDPDFSEFPAFGWIASLNPDSSASYSESSTGLWYMPGEYDQRYELYPIYYTNSTLLDAQITAAGGTTMTTDRLYMSSSEHPTASNASYRRAKYTTSDAGVTFGTVGTTSKTSTADYIRAVMDFDLDNPLGGGGSTEEPEEPEEPVVETDIEITTASATLTLGTDTELEFAATVTPATTETLTWISSDVSVAYFDGSTLKVLAAGTTSVTATVTVDGVEYTSDPVTITVKSADAGIEIGDYLYSDLTYNSTIDTSKSLMGVVSSVNEDGTSGTIIHISNGSYAWASSTTVTAYTTYLGTSTDYASTGLGIANMKAVYAGNGGSFDDMPVFTAIAAMNSGVDYTSVSDTATGVWYLPCEGDAKSIIAPIILADGSVVNDRITAAGGDALGFGGTSNYYIGTSSEVGSGAPTKNRTVYTNANATTINAGGIVKSTALNVRPMMNFDLE